MITSSTSLISVRSPSGPSGERSWRFLRSHGVELLDWTDEARVEEYRLGQEVVAGILQERGRC
jgi:hypothetical protein